MNLLNNDTALWAALILFTAAFPVACILHATRAERKRSIAMHLLILKRKADLKRDRWNGGAE